MVFRKVGWAFYFKSETVAFNNYREIKSKLKACDPVASKYFTDIDVTKDDNNNIMLYMNIIINMPAKKDKDGNKRVITPMVSYFDQMAKYWSIEVLEYTVTESEDGKIIPETKENLFSHVIPLEQLESVICNMYN